MITDRLKIIRNVSVLTCPVCSGIAHTAGTESRSDKSECLCGCAYIIGKGSWVSAYGLRGDYNRDDYYFRCDAVLDLDSNEYIFVKRTYDTHELYPELGVLDEI